MKSNYCLIALLIVLLFSFTNLAYSQNSETLNKKGVFSPGVYHAWKAIGFSSNQAHIFTSLFFLGTGDYGKAEKSANEVVTTEAGQLLKGEALFRKGSYKKAYIRFEQLAEKYPENSVAWLRMGTILIIQDDLEKAEEVLSRAANLDKSNMEAQLQLGRLYALRGESPAKALASLRNAYSEYKESTELNFELGNIYYEKGSYKEAEYFYDRAVKLGAREDSYRLALAKSMYYQGKNEEALKIIRRVLKGSKKNPEANYFLGAIQLERKKYPRAIQAFMKAERQGKGFGDSRYYIGKIKFFQGLHQEAIKDLLEFRMQRIAAGEGKGANFADSMKTILNIETIFKVERMPQQIPGSKEGMIRIPGRELFFGWDGEAGRTDEQKREVKQFLMDSREVSNSEYAVFVKAIGWRVPQVKGKGSVTGGMHWNQETKLPAQASADQPVLFVSWRDALAYAAWVGKTLPAEAEWELAARGRDIANIYPWGDDKPSKEKVCFANLAGPVNVDKGYLDELGLRNIVGNVAEWCLGLSQSRKKPYRGGHWRSSAEDLKVFNRGELSLGATNAFVGFRCVTSISEEE